MTPARLLLHIAVNVIVIIAYLGYHLLINTFVSELCRSHEQRFASTIIDIHPIFTKS